MEKGILRGIEDPQRGLPRRPLHRPLEDGIVDVAPAEHHGESPRSREASKGRWIMGNSGEISWEIHGLQPLRPI